jgi:hypothetical protein
VEPRRPRKHAPSVTVTDTDDSGRPVNGLPATGFVLKSGTPPKPVVDFSVQEYVCRTAVNVAFVLCLPEGDDAAEQHFIGAIQDCQNVRRQKDRWLVSKVSPKLKPKRQEAGAPDSAASRRGRFSILNVDFDPETAKTSNEPVMEQHVAEYSAFQTRIDLMLQQAPVMLGASAGDDDTLTFLKSLLVNIAGGNLHLIFLGAGPHSHVMDGLQTKASDLGATVHVLAESQAWQSESVRDVALQTGGVFRVVPDRKTMRQACFDTYSALLHHYRITWKDAPVDGVELDIYSDRGKASTSFEQPAVLATDMVNA